MRRYLRLIGCILFFVGVLSKGMSQIIPSTDKTKQVYQLSGIVVGQKSGQPVPYSRIRINQTRRGMIADEKGFYSLPVVESDTLYISSIGFRKTGFSFSDYLNEYQGDKLTPYIYVIHYLEEDTLTLPPIVIYPYDTPEKIKTAILAMDIPKGTPEDMARNNLNAAVMRLLMEELPKDGRESVSIGENLYAQRVLAANKVQTLPFLDPIAIGRLIGYMSDRSKQKKEKIYNFWPEE
jgi:hypothetical protein